MGNNYKRKRNKMKFSCSQRCKPSSVCCVMFSPSPVVALGAGHLLAPHADVGEGGAAGEDGPAPGGRLGLGRRALGPGAHIAIMSDVTGDNHSPGGGV